MLISRNEAPAVGVPESPAFTVLGPGQAGVAGLGMIPDWQFSLNPAINPNINPHVVYPEGVTQSTPQPLGPYMGSGAELAGLRGLGELQYTIPVWLRVLSVASGAASAYHGYKRNESVGWAIWWGLMGGIFPVITPAIGFAQGFGKRKKGK